jgi:dTDP-glucose pyrophosphorylase
MILILTMAGLYSRFTAAGYKFPKYLLPWGDKPILSKILHELSADKALSDVLLVGNVRDESYVPHVHAILRAHRIAVGNLVWIKDTKGQAETAMLGLQHLESVKPSYRGPVVFHNIDTILYGRKLQQARAALVEHAGWIDVFRSSNHSYSYVLVDEQGRLQEIAEKIVISNLATSGLYGFSSLAMYRDNYDPEQDQYVTSVYKRMISRGQSVLIGPVHSENDTVVLGTPTEYINASITVAEDQL